MKPFNLEDAKSGKRVCYRDGTKARILCFDAPKVNGQTLISMDEDGSVLRHWDDGMFALRISDRNLRDMFMVDETERGWIAIRVGYTTEAGGKPCSNCYPTREDASNAARLYWKEDEFQVCETTYKL